MAEVIIWIALACVVIWVLPIRQALAALIRRAFGGYEQLLSEVDESAPLKAIEPKKVLVIGGGLAGISAAANLAERGMDVTLREKNEHLGGKVGAWTIRSHDGTELEIEHGFHAFFRHYYNLRRFLDRSGVTPHLTPIDDYLILEESKKQWRFKDVEASPVLNLIALARGGLYRFSDILFGPALHKMDAFLKYDPEQTFAEHDTTSYAQFAAEAQLPKALTLVFNTFARAFFADADRLSMAELLKSFHFFYLSHDHGLLYDYPAGDYQQTVLGPIRAHLESLDVTIELGRGVEEMKTRDQGMTVDGEDFDYVVLATSSVGAQRIAAQSPQLARTAPSLTRSLKKLRPSQRYAVARIWLDRDIEKELPVFFATERLRVLDSVTTYHHITEQARKWAADFGGSVLELHCYAVPDDVADDEIGTLMVEELFTYFPELKLAQVVHEHLQVNNDFTAFHVGMSKDRPTTATELDQLVLAGDWVKTPLPAMLMEAAYSSGLLAANDILVKEGLREHEVYTVPQRGLLAGIGGKRVPSESPSEPHECIVDG